MIHQGIDSFFQPYTETDTANFKQERVRRKRQDVLPTSFSPTPLSIASESRPRALLSSPPPVTYVKMSLGRNTSATWGFFFLQLTPSVSPSPETNRCSAAFLQRQKPDVSPDPPVTLSSNILSLTSHWQHSMHSLHTATTRTGDCVSRKQSHPNLVPNLPRIFKEGLSWRVLMMSSKKAKKVDTVVIHIHTE